MPLKIIKKIENAETNINKNNINLNIEETIKKMFFLCCKIIDSGSIILKNIDFNKLINQFNDEEYNIEYEKISKIINFFALIFGKKYTIIEALLKTTNIIKDLNALSIKLGIKLINNNTNDNTFNQLWSDEEIEAISNIMKDFNLEEIKKTAQKIRQEVKENEIKKNIENKKEQNIKCYEILTENNKNNL